MNFRIVYKAWWMFWAEGMVVWPWMWFRRTSDQVSDRLYRHELQHCYQVKQLGRFRFYTTYIWLWLRHGYWKHPYEVEARERQNDPLTAQEVAWRKRGRIEL